MVGVMATSHVEDLVSDAHDGVKGDLADDRDERGSRGRYRSGAFGVDFVRSMQS